MTLQPALLSALRYKNQSDLDKALVQKRNREALVQLLSEKLDGFKTDDSTWLQEMFNTLCARADSSEDTDLLRLAERILPNNHDSKGIASLFKSVLTFMSSSRTQWKNALPVAVGKLPQTGQLLLSRLGVEECVQWVLNSASPQGFQFILDDPERKERFLEIAAGCLPQLSRLFINCLEQRICATELLEVLFKQGWFDVLDEAALDSLCSADPSNLIRVLSRMKDTVNTKLRNGYPSGTDNPIHKLYRAGECTQANLETLVRELPDTTLQLALRRSSQGSILSFTHPTLFGKLLGHLKGHIHELLQQEIDTQPPRSSLLILAESQRIAELLELHELAPEVFKALFNIPSGQKQLPIHYLAQGPDLQQTIHLIDPKGVVAPNRLGNTALHRAAESTHPNNVSLLLELLKQESRATALLIPNGLGKSVPELLIQHRRPEAFDAAIQLLDSDALALVLERIAEHALEQNDRQYLRSLLNRASPYALTSLDRGGRSLLHKLVAKNAHDFLIDYLSKLGEHAVHQVLMQRNHDGYSPLGVAALHQCDPDIYTVLYDADPILFQRMVEWPQGPLDDTIVHILCRHMDEEGLAKIQKLAPSAFGRA
ncbi:MAG: hypothetical protein KDK78_02610, partial [Chlamydiia bacterium]|nr:hypothetical protein [Chlamydiia bacterium]